MRILYGVVGEGMGHATRSRVVLEHLLSRGHGVRVVVSGRAHRFLVERFRGRAGIEIREIHGLVFAYRGKGVDRGASLRANLAAAPAGLRRNLRAWRETAEEGFRPDAVISDFESWAYFHGILHGVPVVSIDNVQMVSRCRHPRDVVGPRGLDFLLARAAVRAKLPGAWHYLIASFFFPPVARSRTTLVPPLLRPEVLALRREPRDHVLVYQTSAANEALVPELRRLRGRFVVYGMGRAGSGGNVSLRPFSEEGFLEDLRTARAVVAGGGFSLMSECVHLRVPLLSCPVEHQSEQEVNARWLRRLGYGDCKEAATAEAVEGFLARLPEFERALGGYAPRDNAMALCCVDECLARIARGERGPARLDAPALGKFPAGR